MQNLDMSEVASKMLTMAPDERIMIPVDPNLAKDVRFAFYRRQALENLMMSYINRTTEMADQMNLQNFTDQAAKTFMDEAETIRKIGLSMLGEELYDYLSTDITPQKFSIDFERNLLIIHPAGTVSANYITECDCGSVFCSIENAKK